MEMLYCRGLFFPRTGGQMMYCRGLFFSYDRRADDVLQRITFFLDWEKSVLKGEKLIELFIESSYILEISTGE